MEEKIQILEVLEAKVQMLEDIEEIIKLQRAYGFYLEHWMAEDLIDLFADCDIDVIFHCDTDWTRFLPYFKEFPRGRCVLQLDGATDIFKAKEILRDHMALHGDVPATLLTLGTPNK